MVTQLRARNFGLSLLGSFLNEMNQVSLLVYQNFKTGDYAPTKRPKKKEENIQKKS